MLELHLHVEESRECRKDVQNIHFAIMLLRITQAWELRATSSPRPKAASSVSPDEDHPSCDGTPSPEAGQLPLQQHPLSWTPWL